QAELEKSGKPPTGLNAAGGYLELTVGTKDAWWPYSVKEFGADGKTVGTTIFDNTATLARFLTRAAKDPTGPREVRITARADVRADLLKTAIEACQAAGLKSVVHDNPGGDPASPVKP